MGKIQDDLTAGFHDFCNSHEHSSVNECWGDFRERLCVDEKTYTRKEDILKVERPLNEQTNPEKHPQKQRLYNKAKTTGDPGDWKSKVSNSYEEV